MPRRKIPVLQHEETTPHSLQANLSKEEGVKVEQAKSADALMAEIAFLEEEIRSLYDVLAEGLTYGDISDSGLLNDQRLSEQLRSTLAQRLTPSEGAPDPRTGKVLLSDLKMLIASREGVVGLCKALLNRHQRTFVGTLKAGGLEKNLDEARIIDEAKRLAWAKLVGLKDAILLLGKREKELKELQETPNMAEKVEVVRRLTKRKVRQKMRKLTQVKTPIELANKTNEAAVLRTSEETAALTGVDSEMVGELDDLMTQAAEEALSLNASKSKGLLQAREQFEEEGNLVNSDFLSAFVNYHREMVNMYKMLEKGRIVETDYIKQVMNRALPIIKQNPPGVLYLHGDFGSGKTALAVHLCKTKLGKDPIIVSGNKYLEPDRFTEEFRIKKADERDFYEAMFRKYGIEEKIGPKEDMISVNAKVDRAKSEIVRKVVERREKEDGKTLDEAEKSRIREHIDSVFENKVEGQYILGAMYQAKKEGRPLIVDEANAISPDTLIAFNDELTKKHGDVIQTRTQHGDITQQPGYCIIWTGNTGDRYKNQARYELDPAAFSRVEGIKVEYLPNSTESASQAALMQRIVLEQGGESIADAVLHESPSGARDITGLIGATAPITFEEAKNRAKLDQIFQVLLCKLLNRRLGAMLVVKEEDPYSVFKELYKLSMVARNIMDIFEGKYKGSLIGNGNLKKMVGGGVTAPELTKTLQKANLTMRGLIDRIVGRFKNEGMILDMEYYCFRFIQALAERPEELAIIYKEFQANGFFQINDGWPNPDSFIASQPATASARENAQAFASLISAFNPLSVPKYTDVQMNGDHFSFMKVKKNARQEGQNLVYRYFNSLETMQLMFGLLPPKRLAEYQEMAENLETLNQSSDLEKIQAIVGKLVEIIGNTTGANATKLLKIIYGYAKADRSAKQQILGQIIAETRKLTAMPSDLGIDDLEKVRGMTMNDFEKNVAAYLAELIGLLERTSAITEKEASEMADMSVADRANTVSNLIGNILK